MDPVTWAAILGGTGLLNGIGSLVGSGKKRGIEAAKAETSPWLHMAPEDVKTPNILGDVAGGALSGYQFGQQNKLWDALAKQSTAEGAKAASGTFSNPFGGTFDDWVNRQNKPSMGFT